MAPPRSYLLLFAVSSYLVTCHAGPLGPLPNVTSSELGLKEGSCAVGDVVYMPGDEFPGSSPCEQCACVAGEVRCERQRCEPRPGCKALHRPDQCCPTYQCECEQEGRVYGNGEKLVDPADPCRVCYCQGGEVVCRRIACFLRDDCQPRLVPGRCCPEYDNCPLRGVTAIPSASTMSSVSSIESVVPDAPPSESKENTKPKYQEITIKEITPVSEIPIITDVKIKEILPSPSIEVAEYSSSKSPLIPREATTEKVTTNHESTERPSVIEIHPSSLTMFVLSTSPEVIASSSEISERKSTADMTPSKISFSTQDSINSDIYPSNQPYVGTAGSPLPDQEVIPLATTKAPVIMEEEDQTVFEHNPAFPPIPDDLSVSGNHEDDIMTDLNIESEHISSNQDIMTTTTSTEAPATPKPQLTTVKEISESVSSNTPETPTEFMTTEIEEIHTISPSVKESPMLNLRSAIPTEILNVPSSVPEDINGELDEVTEISTSSVVFSSIATTAELPVETDHNDRITSEKNPTYSSLPGLKILEITTSKNKDLSSINMKTLPPSINRSNTATEVTAQTEFSSLPIETSDQNPHEVTLKDKSATSFAQPTVVEVFPTKISPMESEIITTSRQATSHTENQSFENVETTEFILTSFGSSESTTDAIEVIKISPETGKSAAIIESGDKYKNNVMTDFINLVGDVASISDHTDEPTVAHQGTGTGSPSISDSEELLPVNAGYKSKNSNWNVNSITETVPKYKNPINVNKQKVIEIEDDDDGLTDSPPPYDKVEPTTRRPIIDNVSDDIPENKTDKKDIEIINKTYVPNINRRPTKVVMKKNNEKPIADDASAEDVSVLESSESTTEGKLSASSVKTISVVAETTFISGGEMTTREGGPSTASSPITSQ